ncbi:hypothetical protein NDA12_004487 [Ustilago hordei]|nr:hypothetical protein NDA12_004487 [Ustilago hordei]KAJ1571409.1 hypothetical protein NDA15_001346 [Ustilago hordei]
MREWIQLHEKTWTPMVHTPMKAPNNKETDDELKARYPVLVGKLLWISNTVWLDITFAANTLAHHMSKPTKGAMQAALQVVKYLNQMHDEVLRLGGKNENEPPITIYMDSNWASNLNTYRRSTSGSIVKVFGSMVTWSSHVQKCVSDLAIKAEYMAGLAAMHEVLFHWHLLQGLGDIVMQYIKTDYNNVDYLTKPVSQHLLMCTQKCLGMMELNPLDHSVCEKGSEST